MKLKSFTLMTLGLMMASASFSTEYYVSVNGAGSKDGSSWDNAIDFASWYGKVNSYATGDVFYFAGGTYYAVSATPTAITNGYTFVGGFDPSLTGTSHTTPAYPSSTPTIFSGDVNQNGEQDAADASRFLALKTDTKDSSKPFVIQGIEFTNAFDVTNTKTHGALQLNNCGDVTVKNCRFYNNNTQTAGYGGMALTSYRSTLYCVDSEFTNNSAVQRGGAIYVWVDGTEYSKGYTVLERCLIANNKVTDTTSPLGSAICYTHGPALWIVNSTITGNEAPSGGAVFVNGADKDWKRVTNIISSTIAGNIGGSQINMSQGACLHLANNYIVGTQDDGTTATAAIAITGTTENATYFEITSKGHNIIGGYANAVVNATATPTWDATDNQASSNVFSTVFGSNTLGEEGVLAPIVNVAGADASTLATAIGDWDPAKARVDLTVDQTGAPRKSGTNAGAYALSATGINSLLPTATPSDDAIYNLSGVRVQHPQKGIYIKGGKKVVIK